MCLTLRDQKLKIIKYISINKPPGQHKQSYITDKQEGKESKYKTKYSHQVTRKRETKKKQKRPKKTTRTWPTKWE